LLAFISGDPPPSITWWSGNTPLRLNKYKISSPLTLKSTDSKVRDKFSLCYESSATIQNSARKALYIKHCNGTLSEADQWDREGLSYFTSEDDSADSGPVAMEILRGRKSSTGKYWASVMKALENGKSPAGGKNKNYFTKELRVNNITKAMLDAKNLTCRATNNPELTPVKNTLKLVPFGKSVCPSNKLTDTEIYSCK